MADPLPLDAKSPDRTLVFFALTFASTWALWFASGLTTHEGPNRVLLLLGVFAPAMVALALTARDHGGDGVTNLLRRLIQWDVGARWFLFALLFMPAVKMLAAVLHRAIFGAWPRFGTEGWILMLGGTILSTMIGGQSGEELGWRGYALPRLAERFGYGLGSILLGILWALWHLPLFYFPAGDTYRQSFPLYMLQVVAISITMAWLYVKTDGSLLLAMLFHAAGNNFKDIVPSADLNPVDPLALSHVHVAWITVSLFWVVALWCLVQLRGIKPNRDVSSP